MKKRISIIVPVYNGEEYLGRCIESVIAQKDILLDDIELLCIDDGSTDSSVEILNKYKNTLPNTLKIVVQKNSGVAMARNAGIEYATGEYITFLDQDDWIDDGYCATLLAAIDETQYDAVFSGMKRPNTEGKIVNSDTYRYKTDKNSYGDYMILAVWAKIHRTSFLKNEGIRLLRNSHGEDVAFVYEEVKKARAILCIPYCGYNWFYNDKSVSNTRQRNLSQQNVQAIMNLQQKIADISGSSKSKADTYFIIMITAYYLFLGSKNSSKQSFFKAYRSITQNISDLGYSWRRMIYVWWAPSGVLPLFRFGVMGFMAAELLHLKNLIAMVLSERRGSDE